jgi:hypothetical protein
MKIEEIKKILKEVEEERFVLDEVGADTEYHRGYKEALEMVIRLYENQNIL